MPMPSDLPPMGPRAGIDEEQLERTSTGVPKLDMLLDGGFRKGTNILVIAPPGNEKMALAMQFIGASMGNGKRGIYVATDIAPADAEFKCRKYGVDLASFAGKSLVFIDCYSWTLGGEFPKDRKDIFVQGPSALNDLAIAIGQALQDAGDAEKCVVFHSMSTILLYNAPDVIYKFLQVTGARLKASKATTLFLLEDGMHDQKVVATMKHLVDETVAMRQEGERWLMEFESGELAEPVEFRINDHGIELV